MKTACLYFQDPEHFIVIVTKIISRQEKGNDRLWFLIHFRSIRAPPVFVDMFASIGLIALSALLSVMH